MLNILFPIVPCSMWSGNSSHCDRITKSMDGYRKQMFYFIYEGKQRDWNFHLYFYLRYRNHAGSSRRGAKDREKPRDWQIIINGLSKKETNAGIWWSLCVWERERERERSIIPNLVTSLLTGLLVLTDKHICNLWKIYYYLYFCYPANSDENHSFWFQTGCC